METGTHQPFSPMRGTADETKEKAKQLTHTARERALSTLDRRKAQVSDLLERVADTAGDDQLGGYASDYARRCAGYLRSQSADEIFQSVRRNVRSRPGLLLSACFVAGLAFSRLLKGSTDVGGSHGDGRWSEERP